MQKCQQLVLAQLIHAWAATVIYSTYKPKTKYLLGIPLFDGQCEYSPLGVYKTPLRGGTDGKNG